MKRWLVERLKGDFEDVGYEQMAIAPSGALVFSKSIWSHPEYVVAPGQWLSVISNDEGATDA